MRLTISFGKLLVDLKTKRKRKAPKLIYPNPPLDVDPPVIRPPSCVRDLAEEHFRELEFLRRLERNMKAAASRKAQTKNNGNNVWVS